MLAPWVFRIGLEDDSFAGNIFKHEYEETLVEEVLGKFLVVLILLSFCAIANVALTPPSIEFDLLAYCLAKFLKTFEG